MRCSSRLALDSTECQFYDERPTLAPSGSRVVAMPLASRLALDKRDA
jgi:hypothetical protein